MRAASDRGYTVLKNELLAACETMEISITCEMAQSVEKATKDQSSSRLWFKYRAGRITVSRMKAVCSTDPAHPAQRGVCIHSTGLDWTTGLAFC